MRYLQLLVLNFGHNLKREMEFKQHFFLNILVEIFWTAVTLISLEVIFTQTASIADWSRGQVFVVYGLYRVVSGLNGMLFARNSRTFPFLVNSGGLDLILTKPVNTLFMVSTRLVTPRGIAQTLMGVFILLYAANLIHLTWNLLTITLIIIVCLAGLAVKYAIQMITATSVFWFEKLENIQSLHLSLFGIARFPAEAFPTWLRQLLTFVIPVMFIAAIPASVVLGKSSLLWLLGIVAMSCFLLLITYKFFYFALRHYSSASS